MATRAIWAIVHSVAVLSVSAQVPSFPAKATAPAPALNETVINVSNLESIRKNVATLFKDLPYLSANGQHKIVDENGFSGAWAKSARDPMLLLPLFRRIHLQKGSRLVAYQWLDNIGGYVHVYGLVEGAPYPEASECLRTKRVPASEDIPEYDYVYPMPSDATDDLSSLLEVDGSPESYVEKALFLQEVAEIGAYWHALGWGACQLVDSLDSLRKLASPSQKSNSTNQVPSPDAQGGTLADPLTKWRWKETRPEDLRPRVRMSPDKVEVIWFTFSERGVEHLDRWQFVFGVGNTKSVEPEIKTIAEGTTITMY